MTAPRPSLQRVLVLAIAGVAIGGVVVTAGLTLGLLRLTAQRTALNQLRREANQVIAFSRTLGRGQEAVPPARRGPLGRFGPGVRFFPDGSDVEELPPEGRVTMDGRQLLYVARPMSLRGRSGTLMVFAPTESAGTAPEGLAGRVLVAGLVALGASGAVAYAVARRIAGPLHDLAGAARRMARGERVTLPRDGAPREVDDLRAAFVEMSEHLAEARDAERTFLLSVSHELRTPLTAIRGYGEAIADGTASAGKAGDVIVRESRRLERLVGDLIDLARLHAGEFSVQPGPVELGDLCEGVVESLGPKAAEAEVSLETSVDAADVVSTDLDRAHQMIANLVENALRVTPAGGRVTVEARGATVVVSDTGPGLEPEDVAHAFERFYLWRRYRGLRPVGTGLGLAIVGELARALGVRVDVSSSRDGTRFALEFPA